MKTTTTLKTKLCNDCFRKTCSQCIWKQITHTGGFTGDWEIINLAKEEGLVTRYAYKSILYLEQLGFEVVDEGGEVLLPYYRGWLNIEKTLPNLSSSSPVKLSPTKGNPVRWF